MTRRAVDMSTEQPFTVVWSAFPPVMVGSIPKAAETHFVWMEHQTWRMYCFAVFQYIGLCLSCSKLGDFLDGNLDPWWFQAYPFLVQSLAEQFG